MGKLIFFFGFAAGYVLGAKAGRKRYDQISRLARKVADNPKVQGVAGLIEAQAEGAINSIRGRIGNESTQDTDATAQLNGSAR